MKVNPNIKGNEAQQHQGFVQTSGSEDRVVDPKLKPLYRHAELSWSQGNYKQAITIYANLYLEYPRDSYLLYALGSLWSARGRNDIALPYLERSVEIDPEFPEAWVNLGIIYRQESQDDLAEKAYFTALKLDPDNANTYGNYAGIYVNHGQPDLAVELADKGLALQSDNAMCHHHKSLALLEQGKYEEGWKEYEWRRKLPKHHIRPFKCDEWNGEERVDILAISGEQGLGDEIMFLSMLNQVREKVGEVVVECNHRLVRLFERSFGVRCYPDYKTLIQYESPDAHIPMGSLGQYFRTTKKDFKNAAPYLKPDMTLVQHYRKRFVKPGKPVVGIAWLGGSRHPNTHWKYRNVPIDQWGPILAQDASFVSLQYNDKDYKHKLVERWPHNNEIDELCAMAYACDLIITVDQTIVHQAGAMGKETWVLVGNKPSFRYGVSGPMDWYPSVKLYRQEIGAKEWASVVRDIAKDLEAYCENYQSVQEVKPRTA